MQARVQDAVEEEDRPQQARQVPAGEPVNMVSDSVLIARMEAEGWGEHVVEEV